MASAQAEVQGMPVGSPGGQIQLPGSQWGGPFFVEEESLNFQIFEFLEIWSIKSYSFHNWIKLYPTVCK